MGDNGMSLYPNTCLVESKTTVQTVAGTVSPTYATRIASLACSIQNRNLQTTNTFGKPTLVNVYKLYTPFNSTTTAIDPSDRITWRGKIFEITGIGDGAGRQHQFEIDMLEVK